jgi:hypothetical protein
VIIGGSAVSSQAGKVERLPHVGSFGGIFGLFLAYFGIFLSFFLGYGFLDHTSDNVAARAKKMFFQEFFVVLRGLSCSFSCHFGSFGGIFGLFLADFGIFLSFFLVQFFLVIRPIRWLRGQKKMFFSIFGRFRGSFSGNTGSWCGIFWTFLALFYKT